MKSMIYSLSLVALLALTSCVQKSYQRVVVVTLDVSKEKDVQNVGIRGNGQPLSWDTDYPMQALVKDSLYRTVVTTKTGYLFAEIKCTVNGNFELQNQNNRRIEFDLQKDTTYVNLVFNKR
ncbi:hypothetical protein [Flavobacterium sp.]|uniref:hypothetical protein n=1 Tax=Flavobacterium sp. TaxID=239 RepID=UPI0026218936|nr:hypothetical protein [Flavobacterium sp.]